MKNYLLQYEFDDESKRDLDEFKLNQLRQKRQYILLSFDKWEKAVLRGREEDSEEIMNWYNDVLDLQEEAFNNIPEEINKYN